MEFVSPSREELLQSIRPGMRLTRDFFKRIYGYELSYPGFSDQAVTALESAGCSRAREYYQTWVSEYQIRRNADQKPAAAWYVAELERKWKGQEGVRTRIEDMSSPELLKLLRNLTAGA